MFHRMTIDDIKWVTSCLEGQEVFSADYAPLNIFGWAEEYSTEIDLISGCLSIRMKSDNGNWAYLYPCGNGDVKSVISYLENYHKENYDSQFSVICNPKQSKNLGDGYIGEHPIEYNDYIYNTIDLVELKGSKYHSKRNHISQFDRKYEWKFLPLNKDNLNDAIDIMVKWQEQCRADSYESEMKLLELSVAYAKEFNIIGGILYAHNVPVALSVGTLIREGLLDVHLEKADTAYSGVYSKIMNEFTKYAYERTGAELINREEDMGIENLRKAKLSLHPAFLEEKHIFTKQML